MGAQLILGIGTNAGLIFEAALHPQAEQPQQLRVGLEELLHELVQLDKAHAGGWGDQV